MRRHLPRLQALALVVLLTTPIARASGGEGVPRADCFPIERLDPALRPRAEAVLLRLLDSEALYTVVGGVKPVSSSFWTGKFPLITPDLGELDDLRAILETFQCGDAFHADLLVFAAPFKGTRMAHAWIAHRPTLRAAIGSHRNFFGVYGISPRSHPIEVVEKMEHASKLDRLRASGYLFGYPDAAVDFFVKAEYERSRAAGPKAPIVPRDFLSAPTFDSERHRFVWAVPKGHTPDAEDRALIERATAIQTEYRRRRELYIGPGRPGVIQLLRDWFDDGRGVCSPENAMRPKVAPLMEPAPPAPGAASLPSPRRPSAPTASGR